MWAVSLSLCFGILLITTLVATWRRLAHGVTWHELAYSRFYELSSVRSFIWTVQGLSVATSLTALILLMKKGYMFYSQNLLFTLTAVQLIPFLLATVILLSIAWFIWIGLIQVDRLENPKPKVAGTRFIEGIPDQYFFSLGLEKFPNQISKEQITDNWIRAAVVIVLLGLVAFLFYAQQPGNIEIGPSFQSFVDMLPRKKLAVYDTAGFVLWSAGILLVILLFNNYDYTFVPFRWAIQIQFFLATLCIVSFGILNGRGSDLIFWLGFISVAIAFRTLLDLGNSWNYNRIKRVYNPIVDTLRIDTPYLSEVPDNPCCKLPSLNEAMLVDRISQGCRNVEGRGIFVTKFFARFMNLLVVQHRSFASSMLSYLTVRRYITVSSLGGTRRGLRHPDVPRWNRQLFPVHPPNHYVDWLDPLALGEEWHIVKVCHQCNGKGEVQKTETYYVTEYYTESYIDNNGRSASRQASRQVAKYRQVWVTCPTCNGCGHLLFQQILNTEWRYLKPTLTFPALPMPELVENAEEVTYFHLPLTEDFNTLPFTPIVYVDDDALTDQMRHTAQSVTARHATHSAEVIKLHGAEYLYRSDFKICGFRTIYIYFQQLGGRVGWFFGKRPEFYFPRLPLSYETVLIIICWPPLLMVLVQYMLNLASYLNTVLI